MYKRGVSGWMKHLDFIILDCICLVIAFNLAYIIRHGLNNSLKIEAYRELTVAILIINFLAILFLETMKDVLKRGYINELRATLLQGVAILLLTITYMFGSKSSNDYSRIVIFLTAIIYVIITYIIRLRWKKYLLKRLNTTAKNALLIMADAKAAGDIIKNIQTNNLGQHAIIGVVATDDTLVGSKVEGVEVVATHEDIDEYAVKNWVDEILVHANGDISEYEEVLDTLVTMGMTVHVCVDGGIGQKAAKQVVGSVGGCHVISTSMNYMTARQYVIKRSIDILGGLVGCLITGILAVILTPIIKIQSPGPVFFVQERIGKNGKPFKIYKFRSMYMDAEERKAELIAQNRLNNNLMFKMDFDPRVIGNRIIQDGKQRTGVGQFIRKYSIDEFPQFFNVLKGEMSIVGTRPPLVSEYNQYSAYHKARLATKPGITGLWQVSGRSDILDFDEVVRLDTEYINNWSIGLDLKIIVKTVLTVIQKNGSM